MSAIDRIRRSEELFDWSRDYIARSIVAVRGKLPLDELRREVALRQYGANPVVRELIEELRDRAAR
jgi:hypothetical protein